MNPSAASKNLHHTVPYRSEQEWLEDMFGKGPGDPDEVGYYPGQPTDTQDYPLTCKTATIVANESEGLPF